MSPLATTERPMRLTDADREAWATYERANKRAARDYRIRTAPPVWDRVRRQCTRCTRKTSAAAGLCRACSGAS